MRFVYFLLFDRVLFVVVVVITLTHNTMQSVVAGHTLEWKKYLGSKTEAKDKKQAYIRTPPLCGTADTREAKRRVLVEDKNLKKKMKRSKKKQKENRSR